MNTVASGKEDILQIFLDILKKTKTAYCIIGGLRLIEAYPSLERLIPSVILEKLK